MNPFQQTTGKRNYFDWSKMSCKPYNKFEVQPYTKLRIILACGAEFEAVNFSHRFFRCCPDNDARRVLAELRRDEQQQQKRLASLKPINEGVLEHTIGYEQLAVELTALFASRESDKYVKQALDFALLEDFDHLYRYANQLDMDKEVKAEDLLGKLTEVMPGRPTISEHRAPADDVKRWCNFAKSNLLTKLQVGIITAAEQQTMNYYMNQAAFYLNKSGRELYTEIAMIEEEHVTLYGGLTDATVSWEENLLMHEYTECYLYWSLKEDETDAYVKKIFAEHFDIELGHLAAAAQLLERRCKKDWRQVISDGEFPELIAFTSQVDYVRKILGDTVCLTGHGEDYADVNSLAPDCAFFEYQKEVNADTRKVPSHGVIEKHIADCDVDYRYQTKEHPVVALQDRKKDNTEVGR